MHEATEIGQYKEGFLCSALQIRQKSLAIISFSTRFPYSHLLTFPPTPSSSSSMTWVRYGAIELVALCPYRLPPTASGRLSTQTELVADFCDGFVLVNKAALVVDLGRTSDFRRAQIPTLTSARRSGQRTGHSLFFNLLIARCPIDMMSNAYSPNLE